MPSGTEEGQEESQQLPIISVTPFEDNDEFECVVDASGTKTIRRRKKAPAGNFLQVPSFSVADEGKRPPL